MLFQVARQYFNGLRVSLRALFANHEVCPLQSTPHVGCLICRADPIGEYRVSIYNVIQQCLPPIVVLDDIAQLMQAFLKDAKNAKSDKVVLPDAEYVVDASAHLGYSVGWHGLVNLLSAGPNMRVRFFVLFVCCIQRGQAFERTVISEVLVLMQLELGHVRDHLGLHCF